MVPPRYPLRLVGLASARSAVEPAPVTRHRTATPVRVRFPDVSVIGPHSGHARKGPFSGDVSNPVGAADLISSRHRP